MLLLSLGCSTLPLILTSLWGLNHCWLVGGEIFIFSIKTNKCSKINIMWFSRIFFIFYLSLSRRTGPKIIGCSYFCKVANSENQQGMKYLFFPLCSLLMSSLHIRPCALSSLSLSFVSSLVYFKNCPEYLTKVTAQVFIPLMRFLLKTWFPEVFSFFWGTLFLFFLSFIATRLIMSASNILKYL